MLYSQSSLLPMGPHGLPTTGGSESSFHIDSRQRTHIRSDTGPGPQSFGSVTGPGTYDNHVPHDSAWVWLVQPPTSHLHNVDQCGLHGALFSPTTNDITSNGNAPKHTNEKTSRVHRHHNTLESNVNACDLTPYQSSFEELNQADCSMLDDGAYSSRVPFIHYAHPPHPAEATDAQSLVVTPHDLTTAGMTDEEQSRWEPP
jgi:hypothetical protein